MVPMRFNLGIVAPLGLVKWQRNHKVFFSNGSTRVTKNSNYPLKVQMKSNNFFI